MARVNKDIWIEASPERIFDYISFPSNLPEIWPSLVEIYDIKPLPNGNYSLRWTYEMLCMRFEGKAEYTEIVPNEYYVCQTRGGIKSTIIWTVRPWEDKTRVTFTVDYKVPIPLLGKLAEAIIVKATDHEGDLVLVNLKNRMEANKKVAAAGITLATSY